MCNFCGKNKNGSETQTPKIQKPPEAEEACRFCGGKHRKEELEPYVEPFPQIPPYPREGIYGMYPLQTTCKKAIMDHLLRFQKKLMSQSEKAKMKVKMMEYKGAGVGGEDPEQRVASQLDQLDADVQQLKHELMVEALRQKYGSDTQNCPCYEP